MTHPRELGFLFTRWSRGEIPFIASVLDADVVATLVHLKAEVEGKWGSGMKMSFVGGLEARLIAKEPGNLAFTSGGRKLSSETSISKANMKSASSWTPHVYPRSCGVDAG